MERKAEFDGERAALYNKAMTEYPNARQQDLEAMFSHLNPKSGEHILGFGEGNGYFCPSIAKAIGLNGRYLITDPSKDQLNNLKKNMDYSQLEIQVIGAEGIEVDENSFDKIWSFGAFHHVPNQTEAMKKIYNSLKPSGKLILCDVFQGSELAKHFDYEVARYCNVGHEVKFLSDEFAKSLCHLAGFNEENVKIEELPQKWLFDSELDIGKFMYNLHALTKMPGSEEAKIQKSLKNCKDILGVEYKNGKYELNWPMKVLIAKK
jgi:arsenite methyltransferase